MTGRFASIAMLLIISSACSSSATSTASPATTSPSDETATTTNIVTTTVSPTTTTLPCRVVEGRRDSKLFPGDCDGNDRTVSLLQESLNMAGFTVPVTGFFDAATKAAVKAFQAANGLEVDGLVGPLTWGALPNPDEIGD